MRLSASCLSAPKGASACGVNRVPVPHCFNKCFFRIISDELSLLNNYRCHFNIIIQESQLFGRFRSDACRRGCVALVGKVAAFVGTLVDILLLLLALVVNAQSVE